MILNLRLDNESTFLFQLLHSVIRFCNWNLTPPLVEKTYKECQWLQRKLALLILSLYELDLMYWGCQNVDVSPMPCRVPTFLLTPLAISKIEFRALQELWRMWVLVLDQIINPNRPKTNRHHRDYWIGACPAGGVTTARATLRVFGTPIATCRSAGICLPSIDSVFIGYQWYG